MISDLISPERVREIANNVVLYFPTHNWNDLLVKGILDAAPEIARAVLEMAARRFDEKAREMEQAQIKYDHEGFGKLKAAAEDTASLLRQMAKEITDA